MGITHVVQDGETVASIAQYYGLVDWHKLYQDRENQAFRARNPDPDELTPGDLLFLREVEWVSPEPAPERFAVARSAKGNQVMNTIDLLEDFIYSM